MHPLLRFVVRHLMVFGALLLLVTMIVFVTGLFVELHPDAHRDGLLSIVYVYPVVLVANGLFALVKRLRRGDRATSLDGLVRWYQECGVLVHDGRAPVAWGLSCDDSAGASSIGLWCLRKNARNASPTKAPAM